MIMDKQDFLMLTGKLNCIIDQAKFIRNILVYNDTAEVHHVQKYIEELIDMTNSLKIHIK